MPRKFKSGDWVKVRGKRNSPKMQVLKYVRKKDNLFGLVAYDTFLKCVWYKNGERKTDVFHQNKLIRVIESGGLFKTFLTKPNVINKYVLVITASLLSFSCNGQKSDTKQLEIKENETIVEQPKGTWKVDKEFDENGNLIRYDSIYSWSSNGKFDNLSTLNKDSLLQSFKSRFFTNFSDFENQGFDDVFSKDSLFSKHFFNDDFFESDFGQDFMDLDSIRKQMIARQKKFLEKYQSEFIKPEDEN